MLLRPGMRRASYLYLVVGLMQACYLPFTSIIFRERGVSLEAIGLVGAIDGQVQRRQIVQRRQGDAQLARQRSGLLGCWHAEQLFAAAHPGRQHLDKDFGCGAGAQPQLHAVLDIVQSLGGDGAFEGVLVSHGRDLTGPPCPGQAYSTVTDFARFRG